MKKKTMNLPDRERLAELWARGDKAVEIAVALKFSPTAIYDELKRGRTEEFDRNCRFRYDPMQGQAVYQANLRNRGRRRVVKDASVESGI